MAMMDRFKRLGIQKRIMLYVTIGLAAMFGSFALVGLRSIQQATELVYDERLSIAHTTAGILTRDFLHVVRDVREMPLGSTADARGLERAAQSFLAHLSGTDPFLFFQVTGVWVLSPEGTCLAQAGWPAWNGLEGAAPILAPLAERAASEFVVLPGVDRPAGGVPFATIATRVTDPAGAASLVVAVHTVSINSSAPYVPPSYWYTGATELGSPARMESPQTRYHLEVVSPEGLAVLGIGQDETPGAPSRHFPTIQHLMAEGQVATLLHQPAPGEAFEPHVMAVVPLVPSSFYVILEQPADVSLALPMQVRQTIVVLTSLGFLAALLVAWVTTRHVVKPTEELTGAAQRMARGDLDSPIRVTAQDEVGVLAESLDTMRQELKAAHERIEDTNRGLEAQVRERTARLEEVLKKVISVQEEERHRLARELHDETAQTLGALSIALDRARAGLEDASPPTLERMLEAKAIATRLLEDTRRLILDLRPTLLDDLGLGPALRWYAETRLEEPSVAVTVEVDPRASRIPKHIEVSLFRVAQEAVNNIARHANATHARVRLGVQGSTATLVIADDGTGFDVGRVLGPGARVESIGLVGMQERVRLLDGRLHIRSQEGRGTTVAVEIPIAEEAG